MLSALEDLCLSFGSWRKLKFWDNEVSSESGTVFHLPPIRVLRLFAFDMEMQWEHVTVSEWMEKFFAQLKKEGDLDAFKMLAITEMASRTRPLSLKGAIYDYLPQENISTNFNC